MDYITQGILIFFPDDDDHGDTIDPVAELTESESEDDELDPDAIYVPEDEDGMNTMRVIYMKY